MYGRSPSFASNIIYTVYHILHESTEISAETHLYMRKWSLLLERPIPLRIWANIWSSTFKSSKCVAQRETAVKILMFWYKTPDRLYRDNPALSPKCWRCSTEIGSHFHIFWSCSFIQTFWSEVMQLLQTITGLPLPLDPINYLLGFPFLGIPKSVKRLTSYILLATKRAIPLCWLSTSPSTCNLYN